MSLIGGLIGRSFPKKVTNSRVEFSPESFWRALLVLKQPMLLVQAGPFKVVRASESALEVLGLQSVQAVDALLTSSVDAPLLARLELALTGGAVFEQQFVRLRGPPGDCAVRLTVSALLEFKSQSVGLLFLVAEQASELTVWTGFRELLAKLPHPAWLTDAKGIVSSANQAFLEFPGLLLEDGLIEAVTAEDVELLQAARETLRGLPGKVRTSPELSDVTLTLNSLGTWRVMHFAITPHDAKGLVCAIALRSGEAAIARDPAVSELSKLMPPAVLEKVMQVRERERQVLGREIHDSLGQELTVLKLELRRLSNLVSGAGLAKGTVLESMKSVKTQADKLALSARQIAYELRPEFIEANGLTRTVQELVLSLRKRGEIAAQLEIAPGWVEPEDGMAHHLHRSVQEMLTNVCKHARATSCLVKMGLAGHTFWLEVHDDGVGMASESKVASIGLNSLRERAEIYGGSVVIRTRPELAGTLVRVEFLERRWPPGSRR